MGDIHCWNVHQHDRGIDFNGFLWVRGGGNVLIDPMPLCESDLDGLRQLGGAKWILIDNADHLRAAPSLAETLGAEILAPEPERDRFGPDAGRVASWFSRSSDLPTGLSSEVDVFFLEGGKSPAEPCFYLKPAGALYFGDLVRSHRSGELCLLPDQKLADRARVVASLAQLRDLDVRALLLGDGDPIFTGAAEVWRAFLASL